ncbi:MAG: ABC transporter ATP-binding protein [Ignavibacterium album]|uniref:ABC transporter ATP-binding protein n=1 Tax=Ignavibacterium album TaxID=591197 RepID=UPI0026F2461E|nr:ABC transporter ATP-binding protein [Ignavibacterium album]MCX8104431.1 ABC transporter ATP-binding protein [Ignavibacterium album]
MKLIELFGVTKIYDETIVPVKAVDNVDLQIDKGEFTAIVGPSGSGKTTLLNLIGGLDKPTSGKIFVDGTDISTYKEDELINFRLHHIGFVFQAYNLIPVFTAKENVEFIMLLQNIPKEERERRAVDFLDAVGLKDRINNFPTELSGGQQQRVAVARALASTPSFVLADEPTANLDSVSAESLLDLMEELNEKHKMTFIFSTHDEKVIRRAHRIIQLRDGRIEKDIITKNN